MMPAFVSTSRRLALIILLSGALSGILLQGSVFNIALVWFGVVVVLPVWLLLGVVIIVFTAEKPKKMAKLKSVGLTWLAVACATGLSLIIGSGINLWKVKAAQSYVERVVPLLDEIKGKEGAYPATLPVLQTGRLPMALSYWSDGHKFHFWYNDPPGYFCGHTFTSDVRHWVYTD